MQLTYQRLGELDRLFDKFKSLDKDLKNPDHFSDADEYKMIFSHLIYTARTATMALQYEGKKLIGGFEVSYEQDREEMKKNPFTNYIKAARDFMIHTGNVPLRFLHEHCIDIVIGMRMTDGARIFSGGEGSFWVENEGKSNQRDIPVKPDDKEIKEFKSVMHAQLLDIPVSGNSKACQVPDKNPLKLFEEAIPYYRKLAFKYNYNRNLSQAM